MGKSKLPHDRLMRAIKRARRHVRRSKNSNNTTSTHATVIRYASILNLLEQLTTAVDKLSGNVGSHVEFDKFSQVFMYIVKTMTACATDDNSYSSARCTVHIEGNLRDAERLFDILRVIASETPNRSDTAGDADSDDDVGDAVDEPIRERPGLFAKMCAVTLSIRNTGNAVLLKLLGLLHSGISFIGQKTIAACHFAMQHWVSTLIVGNLIGTTLPTLMSAYGTDVPWVNVLSNVLCTTGAGFTVAMASVLAAFAYLLVDMPRKFFRRGGGGGVPSSFLHGQSREALFTTVKLFLAGCFVRYNTLKPLEDWGRKYCGTRVLTPSHPIGLSTFAHHLMGNATVVSNFSSVVNVLDVQKMLGLLQLAPVQLIALGSFLSVCMMWAVIHKKLLAGEKPTNLIPPLSKLSIT